ncbi:cysteine desulfurase family protein [Pseudaestuariivita rosea]|uniref:cysteine desulfurase family protein n=1 Tax=Pseudaestuariivita rosea TaxID=2763263 RepID=UPI001ABB54B5|nr:cysteine desulfurase family protein [Pseudaestuariivita rosea]
MSRVYLDYNATAPLRVEAREAMLAAMDVVGNPSSVHAEGRAAKAIVEKARGQVAALVGCDPQEVIFTSGATEAVAMAAYDSDEIFAAPVEHDCVIANETLPEDSAKVFDVSKDGIVSFTGYAHPSWFCGGNELFFFQRANSETGVLQDVSMPQTARDIGIDGFNVFRDVAQALGKIADLGRIPPREEASIGSSLAVSAHKIGGPKGVGALIAGPGYTPGPFNMLIEGGGQEMGRRSGTENVIGIAGFGAAAEAAARDLEAGVWEKIEKLRNILESAIEARSNDTIFVGKGAERLPNTSCFATPGWKGETQVMQMDLAGFAISAGSACSSGKVKSSRVLRAMGYDEDVAASAIRVSLGPETTEQQVMAFAEAWLKARDKQRARAA